MPTRHRMVMLLSVLLSAGSAAAGSVSAQVSARSVVVGEPFQFVIRIDNTNTFAAPTAPRVPGLTFAGPGTSESRVIANGRVRKSAQYTWQVRASQPGTYEIPAVELTVDGAARSTRAITVEVTEVTPDPRVRAEIIAARPRVVLGASVDLTLRITIIPLVDDELGVRLPPDNMWRVLNGSNWSVFERPLRNLGGRRGRLAGRAVDANGERVYEYELSVSLWPDRTGIVDIEPPFLHFDYPTEIGWRRDLLGERQLTLTATERIFVSPELPRVEVVEPPTEGRPASYHGAVGRFDFAVTAAPTSALVGDPITLTMTTTDRSRGGARLDLLPPPDLRTVPGLAEHFRLPDESLAGTVDGVRKVFRQTIRPVRADLAEIPRIPFSFYDPEAERYVTVWSDAIPIEVTTPRTLTLDEVEGVATARGAMETTELTTLAGGLMANATGPDVLRHRERFRPGIGLLMGLLAPPVLSLTFVAVRQHRLRRTADLDGTRRRTAGRRARQRLQTAAGATAGTETGRVVEAITGYIADRCGRATGAITAAEALVELERRSVDAALLADVRALLDAGERLQYSGASEEAADLADRGIRCLQALEREAAL